jgi:hypothetical protein
MPAEKWRKKDTLGPTVPPNLEAARLAISARKRTPSQPYNKQAARDDYADISADAKLAYVIATAQRVRLQHISDHSTPNRDGSPLQYGVASTE